MSQSQEQSQPEQQQQQQQQQQGNHYPADWCFCTKELFDRYPYEVVTCKECWEKHLFDCPQSDDSIDESDLDIKQWADTKCEKCRRKLILKPDEENQPPNQTNTVYTEF